VVDVAQLSEADSNAPLLLAVDGNSLVHRSFHALAATGMRSVAGEPMWAVRGLLTQLVAAVERIGPAAVVVGFDDPDVSARRQRWPQYKANRVEKLDSLVQQLTLAAAVLGELGIHVVTPAGLEADDVLASAARHALDTGGKTVIMTSDRDSFALIDQHTSVLRIINGGVEASPLLSPSRLFTMLGVTPSQYRDFAALRGDPSDNLPGVRGIGPKTAAKLLAALGTASAAFDDVAAGGDGVRQAIGAGALARLSETAAREAWCMTTCRSGSTGNAVPDCCRLIPPRSEPPSPRTSCPRACRRRFARSLTRRPSPCPSSTAPPTPMSESVTDATS
jgi:5'-3' exonuclease